MAWIFQFIYMHFTLTLCNGFNLLVQPGPLGDFFWNWSREKSGEQVVHFSIQIVTSRDFHVNNKETRQLVYWILGKLVSCIVFKCLKRWYRMDELLLWFSYNPGSKNLTMANVYICLHASLVTQCVPTIVYEVTFPSVVSNRRVVTIAIGCQKP